MAWKKEMTKAEKAEYQAKKQEDMEAVFRRIDEGVQQVFTSEKYKEYLKVMSKFTDYSARNTLLISMQRPDATLVAAYGKWKQLGRQVKKGESGIEILAPVAFKTNMVREIERPVLDQSGNRQYNPDGTEKTEIIQSPVMDVRFRKAYVFDVSQTEGKELPGLVSELSGDFGADRMEAVFKGLEKATKIEIHKGEIEGGARGFYSPSEDTIVIQDGMSDAQTLKTAFHECAHKLLHDPSLETAASQSERNEREVQAESTAFIVAERLGLDTSEYSFPYIASWSDGKQLDFLTKVLEDIQRAAKKLTYSVESELLKLSKRNLSLDEMLADTELDNILKAEMLIEKCSSRGFSFSSEEKDRIFRFAGDHEDISLTVEMIQSMGKGTMKEDDIQKSSKGISCGESNGQVYADAVYTKQNCMKNSILRKKNPDAIGNIDYFELCKEEVRFFKGLHPRHAMNITKMLEAEGIPFSGIKKGETVTLTVRKADVARFDDVVERVKQSYGRTKEKKSEKPIQDTSEEKSSVPEEHERNTLPTSFRDTPIVTLTLSDAKSQGKLDDLRMSVRASEECTRFIGKNLYDAYESHDLKNFAQKLEDMFGLERVMYTLAATIQLKDKDIRFTPEVRKEAEKYYFECDDIRLRFLSEQHPVLLNHLYQVLMDCARSLSVQHEEASQKHEHVLSEHLSDLYLFSTEKVSIHNDNRGFPETTYFMSSVNEYKVEGIGWLDNDDYEREMKLSGQNAKEFYGRVKVINASCIDSAGAVSNIDMSKEDYRLLTEKTFDAEYRLEFEQAKLRHEEKKKKEGFKPKESEFYAVRENADTFSVISLSADGLVTPIVPDISDAEKAKKSLISVYEQRKDNARCELVSPEVIDEKSAEVCRKQEKDMPNVVYRIQVNEDKSSQQTHYLQEYVRNEDNTYYLGGIKTSGDYYECNQKLAELLAGSQMLSKTEKQRHECLSNSELSSAEERSGYVIYQLKDSDENRNICFESFDYLVKQGKMPDIANYEKVYEGKLADISDSSDVQVQLETVFYRFNMERPDDFIGHSLSVSDVVEIKDKAYYVDKFGFKEIPDFFRSKLQDHKKDLGVMQDKIRINGHKEVKL